MMDAGDLLSLLGLILGVALIAIGAAFMICGSIGLLRFPDFYTRLHASGVSDAVGAAILVGGLAFVAGDWDIALKLALLGVLIVATAPTLSQLLANAAHAAGLAPLSGRYVAPRPGAKRAESEQ